MSRLTGKDAWGMFEAYQAVYAPQEEIDEAVKGADTEMRKAASAERRAGDKPLPKGEGEKYSKFKASQISYIDKKTKGKHLTGYAYAEEVEQVDEASPIYSRGGEQRRTQTPRQIGVKSAPHNIPRGGTTISDRDPQGKRLFTGEQDRGKGNKAARRAAALKNEEVDIFDIVLEFLQAEGYAETLEEAEWMMANIIDEEAIEIILGEEEIDEEITSEKGKAKAAEMIAKRSTPSGRAKAGQGANVATIKHIGSSNREGLGGTPPNRKTAGSNRPKSYSGIGGTGNKAARRAGLTPTREKPNAWKEEFVGEAQVANRDPDKYEREQDKRTAPVRGERTPMPPRGNKKREDFEKWYAANVR